MINNESISNERALFDTVTLFKRWLENRNDNKMFGDYLLECGYRSVVIFDAGEIGRILYDEIKKSDVQVCCFYDRNAEGIKEIDGIRVYPFSKLDKMPDADIVLVSTIYNYNYLLEKLVKINPAIRTLYLRDAVYEF